MEFSSYMEVNILIDLALILILSIVVLPRAPKFYVLFLLLNFSQYAFVIPLEPSSGEARLVWSEPSAPENEPGVPDDARKTRETRSASGPAQNPMDLIARAGQGISAVTAALGEPPAAPGNGEISQPMPNSLDATRSGHLDPETSRRISLNPQQVMVDALRDPEAMWLGMRCFWLAACFLLFIQRPQIGAAAACANLMPVPFLARAIPYLHHQIENNHTIQDVDANLRDPETLAEWGSAFWSSHGFLVLILTGAALAVLVVLILIRERRIARDTRALRDQLDPEQFWIDLNGAFHEFSLEPKELVVGDLRFPLNEVARDHKREGFWKLGRSTLVRFIPKSGAADSVPRSPAGYSYQRKK